MADDATQSKDADPDVERGVDNTFGEGDDNPAKPDVKTGTDASESSTRPDDQED